MAKTVLFKVNDASFETVTDIQLTPGTKISSGAFIRQVEIFKIAADYVGRTIDQKTLKHNFATANMTAYPNQTEVSHKLWAGKLIAGWKTSGIIEVVNTGQGE